MVSLKDLCKRKNTLEGRDEYFTQVRDWRVVGESKGRRQQSSAPRTSCLVGHEALLRRN